MGVTAVKIDDVATHGPWMMCVDRPDGVGFTVYHPLQHTRTAITVGREYWPPERELPADYEIPTDDDGYYQPDKYADISATRIANAILMAHAPLMLTALRYIRSDFPSHREWTDAERVVDTVLAAVDAAADKFAKLWE